MIEVGRHWEEIIVHGVIRGHACSGLAVDQAHSHGRNNPGSD